MVYQSLSKTFAVVLCTIPVQLQSIAVVAVAILLRCDVPRWVKVCCVRLGVSMLLEQATHVVVRLGVSVAIRGRRHRNIPVARSRRSSSQANRIDVGSSVGTISTGTSHHHVRPVPSAVHSFSFQSSALTVKLITLSIDVSVLVSDASVVLALAVTVAFVTAICLLAVRVVVFGTVATRICAAPVVAVATKRRAAVLFEELGDCSCRVFGSVL